MNRKAFTLGAFGALLLGSFILMLLGAAAPMPVIRNKWSTNVSDAAPIIGQWRYTKVAAGSTNDVLWDDTGITGLKDGGNSALWVLYAWGSGGSASFGWGPGPASVAGTNGNLLVFVRDTTVTSLKVGVPASSTATIVSFETNNVPVVTIGANGNLQASNGVFIAGMYRKQALLVSSTLTTAQIDGTLQNSYRWTNMVTNVVLQVTNLVEGQEIDYYFTGSTNTGPNYTVSFTVPNPAGVLFHWGDGITNGATSFTVTNNTRVAAFTKVWLETTTTNLEAYFRYLPK